MRSTTAMAAPIAAASGPSVAGRTVIGAQRAESTRWLISVSTPVMSQEENFDDTTMDACLIAAGQRAEHYEMAAYGTLVAWAQAMGHTEAATLLQQTLDEEKAADKKLSGLAEGGINRSAADVAHPREEGDSAAATTNARRGTAEGRR